MPYVGIKIAYVNLSFMYRPILQFSGFINNNYFSRKCVLLTSGAGGMNFVLDNLYTVKL
jgi:hypothetical protein